MNNTRYKNSISKWLFVVVLLLSFFTFSGFVAQSQSIFNKPQTTLIVTQSLRPFKSIDYKRALIALHSKDPVAPILVDLSRLYSQQIKIKLIELAKSYIPLQTSLFYKPNTASQNADDDSALILG